MPKKKTKKKEVDEDALMNFLKFHAKRMTKSPTPWELKFRNTLKDLHYNFKTQVPHITPKKKGYIIDFLLTDYNLIIEIDGASIHNTKEGKRKDISRAKDLMKEGFSILRLYNKQVSTFSKELVQQIIQQKLKLMEVSKISK